MLTAAVAVVVTGLVVVLWRVYGFGPRRARAHRRAGRLLDGGKWQQALDVLAPFLQKPGSETWRLLLRQLAGECHAQALEGALKDRRFEEALPHARQAAELLDQGDEPTARVLEAALADVRAAFARATDADSTGPAEAAAERAREVARLAGVEPPAEADFWAALCVARLGHLEEALPLLTTLNDRVGKTVIDVPLYLGMLLHRVGRPQEALRHLADANRIDAACPFVTWQMGVSLVAAGGDGGLALRALQRALGPRGLPLWLPHPERVWVEAFPEGRSYVRRLAGSHRYVCPLPGDLPTVVRQGQLALAQVYYRLGKYQEAADLYAKLLQDSPPTVLLLRGYGLSLARLGQHDAAYKQLRIALEQEDPKDPFTAAYLALCGALGKPTRPEDKARNVNWALRLLARFPVQGDEEWAHLVAAVHSEARLLELPLAAEDQLLACDALAAVGATDPRAAAAYAHLAATHSAEVRPVFAWLYARAVCEHGVVSPADLDLFARAFADPTSGRAFFASKGWDFDDAEYAYLERGAGRSPGQFPAALGTDYPPRGEAFLLARSGSLEQAGRGEAALASAGVLLALAPTSPAAHDRLACLHYRKGDLDAAVALLGSLHRLAPADPWPLVRRAVLEQERGNAGRRAEAIDHALGLTAGPRRAAVAFLGARLALRAGGALEEARDRLLDCLRDNPDHVEALWCLAAVRSTLGDRAGLVGQAPLMDRPGVPDGRFHLLGAVCHLAAGDYRRVLELAGRTADDPALGVDSHFLLGWAHHRLGDPDAARLALGRVASSEAASADHARALLGEIGAARGAYDEASRWWAAIEPGRRRAWGLDEPLRQTVFLSGLMDLQGGRYAEAAERFREAGGLGVRDRRLGGLVGLALVKAGQRLLYEQAT